MFQKTVRDLTFFYTNEDEFKKLYEEIFKTHQYYVEFEMQNPRILDCGAHIGLTTLYLKSLYPQALITAFEPVPRLVKLLKKNLEVNQIDDVEVIPKALNAHHQEIPFFIDEDVDTPWLSTSSIIDGAWNYSQHTKQIFVETVPLSEYLTEQIDLLKIDIEGSEAAVIQECLGKLHFVKHIIIEFHANRENRPETLVKLLQQAGFSLTITQDGKEIEPDRMTRRKPTLYLIEGVRV